MAVIHASWRRFAEMPLAWRCALIALIPLVVWAYDRVLYDYVPDTAAGVSYHVRVNRFTGATCLLFRDGPPPDGVRREAC